MEEMNRLLVDMLDHPLGKNPQRILPAAFLHKTFCGIVECANSASRLVTINGKSAQAGKKTVLGKLLIIDNDIKILPEKLFSTELRPEAVPPVRVIAKENHRPAAIHCKGSRIDKSPHRMKILSELPPGIPAEPRGVNFASTYC